MMTEEDIENEIPVTNLQYSQGSSEVRVKTVKPNNKGYLETKIERLKVQQTNQICIARPFSRTRPVENTICLSIEDVIRATAVQDFCWRIFERILFRRVLIYGKVVVLNTFSKEGKTCSKLEIDDGSGKIIGTMNLTNEAKTTVYNTAGRLTMERNKLIRKREVGINIKGKFYPPESRVCKAILRSCTILHSMIARNVSGMRKDFQQGPLQKKALVFANLYTNNKNGQVQLNIIDISQNDKIELAWKRQISKLYLKEYMKSA